MQAFVEVFKKLNLLRALEVKGAQLGAVAAWKRHQVGRRLGPVWVHGKGWRGRTMASAMYRSRKIDHGRGRGMLLMNNGSDDKMLLKSWKGNKEVWSSTAALFAPFPCLL
jgi:hypothetical protein